MSGLDGKPFAIPKELVWQAWKQVKANGGAAGADGVTVEAFERDLKDNLYKVWNRMSSGTYFPPPVRAVEIPKSSGGTRMLGVPAVGDRVAQTVAAMALEPRTEAVFHDDSYGYRPRKGALDAVAACRQRCWEKSWVIDLDIRKFFDSVPWDLVIKAVQANVTHEQRWITLYVKRWLAAPIVMPDGRTQAWAMQATSPTAVPPLVMLRPAIWPAPITAAPNRSKVCEPATMACPVKVIAAGVWIAPVESRPMTCALTAVSKVEEDTQSTVPVGVMS